MGVRLLLARPLPGTVGESRRVTHVFPEPESVPGRLDAYCGASFGVGELELLDGIRGMPCEPCLLLAPPPGGRLDGGAGDG
ncbi:hypothetical protein H0B56_17615 [Haloechinothrix sp. YIM 98757]|uniref:Uncharacterized protein n=1 Tax=Haloechinothrix aidingensis TaxID=2752311 RepID=A0A838AE14_9PSEU|nr:hypothetical protein [Haloechinothrix aidingensis]MBA0127368.1 hypothetical protein [Haloechinothrix aidingensis]